MWGKIWPFLFAAFIWLGFWIVLDLLKRFLAKNMKSGKLKDMLLKERGPIPSSDVVEVRTTEEEILFQRKALPAPHESYSRRSFRLTKNDPHFKRIRYIALCAFLPGLVALVALGVNCVLEHLGIVSP